MNSSIATIHFEQQKNIKAASYTIIISGILLFIFFIINWKIQIETPAVSEGIEVNLGNSDFGSGDVPPTAPGNPGEVQSTASVPPPADNTDNSSQVNKPDPNDNEPAVNNIVNKNNINNKNNNMLVQKQPKVSSTPPAPKPKAVLGQYAGNKGSGGNNQDAFNNTRNQGISGGKGDQGNPNGNINSDSYTGNASSGKSGVSISRGLNGKRITKFPSFEDNFNENAKVAVDIQVDEHGNVFGASFQPKGSTTGNGSMKAIALRKAKELKFNPGEEESFGTIIFNFRLKN